MVVPHRWDLDRKVLELAEAGDYLDLRDPHPAVSITGSSGSGKTSSSFRTLMLALLDPAIDAGGVFFTAKPGEEAHYLAWCEASGRMDDVILVTPTSGHCIDVFRYVEVASGGDVTELAELPMQLVEAMERGRAGGGNESAFWDRELRKTLRYAVAGLSLAGWPVLLESIERMILDAPQSLEQVHDPAWQKNSFTCRCLDAAVGRHPGKHTALQRVGDYWMRTGFPTLAEKTRSIVVASVTGVTDLLLQGTLRDLFASGTTTFTPEVTEGGGIIILGLASLENEVGMLGSLLFKSVFQQAMIRRMKRRSGEPQRPVFMALDEAQAIFTSGDNKFLQVAREACITVLSSQNLSGYVDAMGGTEAARTAVENLWGNVSVHIAHSQGERKTQQALADLIGQQWGHIISTHNPGGGVTLGTSEHLKYPIEPSDFARLAQGGPDDDFLCEAVVIARRLFKATEQPYVQVAFPQPPYEEDT